MNIAKFSVKNSLLVNLISVFIFLVGAYSMMHMRREAFPQVSYDIVTVTTIWPGAPAEDVEKFVTIPLEEEIQSISGLDEVTSSSEEGLSSIGIELDPSVKDKRKVVNDIQRAVDRVRNLPVEAEDPEVFELDTREYPVIEVSISGQVDEATRREYAQSLKDELLDIKGVAQVREISWRDEEFWVEVIPEKLKNYHVSMEEIKQALRTRNQSIPGGRLTTSDSEFNVRTTGEFRTVKEIENVIIRANDSGNWLKIHDVATVRKTFEDPVTLSSVNSKKASAMVIVKTEQGDAINVVKAVKETINRFEVILPETMEITTSNDYSYYVKRRLGVLKMNGVIGFVLVLFILFLFLDPIPAFMTAIGIPLALFTAFIVMFVFGITINLVSMLGIILVLGMLVDDGIIVAENVYRYIEEGMPAQEAAIKGTSEVVKPVTVTILTTFAAFGPLMFMDDIIGKFIRVIPIVVMITLSASLFEAFVILPSHLCDVTRLFKGRRGKKKEKRWYVKLRAFYQRFLIFSLSKRYLVLAGLIGIFVFSLVIAKTQMRFLLFAGEGVENFSIRAEAPKGTPLEKTEKMMRSVENIVSQLPREELESYRTFIGSIESERGFDPNSKRGSHLGYVTVFLTPMQERKRSPGEIANAISKKLKDIEGFKKLYTFMPKEGPPVGSDIQVGIKGENYVVMEEIASKFMAFLEKRKGVSDITKSYDFGKKQLEIRIDEEKAKKYFLTVEQIAITVRNVFKGGVATTVKPQKAEEEINVLVRFPKDEHDEKTIFDDIIVPNSIGNLVPLKSVAKIVETEGVYLINHLDGKRVLYVTGSVDNKSVTSLEVNTEIQKEFKDILSDYLGYTIVYGGEFEDQQRTGKNLMVSYLVALFIIFILLVMMFQSLVQPFIVMMAIPFGVVGVILSFWIHDIIMTAINPYSIGRPLNFFAMMGLVGLTGIVVNDSIVLVDFINRSRLSGNNRRESIVLAGVVRLRPVIMTSVTTIGGLVSVAYGIGGGDPFLKPMALAIVWGLTFSTLLTLIGIPCLYAIADDFTEKILHKHMVKDKVV